MACATFPQLDNVVPDLDANAPFPTLVSLGPLLAQAQTATTDRITPASQATAQSRINTLRGRAQNLRGPIIDAATRARMQRGINVAALR